MSDRPHAEAEPMAGVTTRRRFLGLAAGSAGLGGVARSRRARGTQYFRQFIVPASDLFEGNYVGQFLFVDERVRDVDSDVPTEACEFDGWPADETQAYDGRLLDRRREAPTAVDSNVFTDDRKAEIEAGTHFIVQNARQCGSEYVGLECEWIQPRALVGKPPGPTVTETGGQSGFGAVVGTAGLVLAAFVHVLRGSNAEDGTDG